MGKNKREKQRIAELKSRAKSVVVYAKTLFAQNLAATDFSFAKLFSAKKIEIL